MNEESQLKLQAYLDGELPPADARKAATWVGRDSDAKALLAEMTNTRAVLKRNEPERKLPESREFYWSKIERAIRSSDRMNEPRQTPFDSTWWRRLFVPAGSLAAVALALAVAVQQFGFALPFGQKSGGNIETALADTGAVTYRDQAAGMTVIWLSYPAENGFTEDESIDTL